MLDCNNFNSITKNKRQTIEKKREKNVLLLYVPLLTDGGAGVIVKPAFWVNALKSRTVAFDRETAESLPILKSTTSSTSIFSMMMEFFFFVSTFTRNFNNIYFLLVVAFSMFALQMKIFMLLLLLKLLNENSLHEKKKKNNKTKWNEMKKKSLQ